MAARWIDPELAGYQFLWASIRTGPVEVYLVDAAAGDVTNLTRQRTADSHYAAWSPDGEQVTFTSDRDGTHNLYRMDADGRNVRQLTHETAPVVAGMQSFPADGRWIYFGLFGKSEGPLMCRIRPDGGEFRVIGIGVDPAVSPDGNEIVYARQLADGHCLFAARVDGTGERQLTETPNSFFGMHPTWTPDGDAILYADRVGEALELFRIKPNGSARRQLTELRQAATSPAVSPDGKWISFRVCDEVYWKDAATSQRAYAERRSDKRPVWVMTPEGGQAHVVETMRYHTTIDGSRAPMRMKR